MKYFLNSSYCFFCILQLCFGQAFERLQVPFFDGEIPIGLALTGGISTPRLSNVDLNQDGIQDLYIFDREGNVNLTFLTVDGLFKFSPQQAENFPKLNDWVLLYDYNQDGIADIFAANTLGEAESIRVFTGYFSEGKIAFTPYPTLTNTLYYPTTDGTKPLYVSRADIPAIDDIDCDGDLDILSFQETGEYVFFYQNQSVELGYGLDSLIFTLEDECWGGFLETASGDQIKLATDIGICAEGFTTDSHSKSGLHAGSTLLSLDLDGDQDRDLLLADIGTTDVSALYNGGNCNNVWMNAHTQHFPNYDTAANLGLFPALFKLDLDQDGVQDLAYAPNFSNNSSSYDLWFYKNTNSNNAPVYSLKNKQFLIDQMLDFGLLSNPCFVDYNADDLLDIVVGNFGYRLPTGLVEVRLALFENIGTAETPIFQLKEEDYLNFSRFSGQARAFAPTFGDLDNDGDLDFLAGSAQGQLFFAENIAGANTVFEFGEVNPDWYEIRTGQLSTPHIADINGDGLNDLLVGERAGNINYFQNVGKIGNPAFLPNPENSPNSNFFGQVDTREFGSTIGSSAAVVVPVGTSLQLITASESGKLKHYKINTEDVNSEFEVLSSDFGQINEGNITRLSIGDINKDGWYDVLVGNMRGGLAIYTTDLASNSGNTSSTYEIEAKKIQLFPNPSQAQFQLQIENWRAYEIVIFLDRNGKFTRQINIQSKYTQIETSDLRTGLYFLQLIGNTSIVTKRVVIF